MSVMFFAGVVHEEPFSRRTTETTEATPRIGEICEEISPKEVRKLPLAEIQGMASRDLEGIIPFLSRSQLGALSCEQIDQLSTEAVDRLSKKRLKLLAQTFVRDPELKVPSHQKISKLRDEIAAEGAYKAFRAKNPYWHAKLVYTFQICRSKIQGGEFDVTTLNIPRKVSWPAKFLVGLSGVGLVHDLKIYRKKVVSLQKRVEGIVQRAEPLLKRVGGLRGLSKGQIDERSCFSTAMAHLNLQLRKGSWLNSAKYDRVNRAAESLEAEIKKWESEFEGAVELAPGIEGAGDRGGEGEAPNDDVWCG